MPDREKVIKETEDGIAFAESRGFGGLANTMRDALALLKEQESTINELQNAYGYLQKQFFEAQDKLLKEQDERYKNMVLSWLREIAINNVDCNRDMTFLDAVEDIRDRASYGLKQYFIDKQEGR